MSESTSNTITVGISSRYLTVFTAGGALIGLIFSFIVGPVVSWLLSLIGDAPGPLRLAAELPLALAIPVLTIIGAVAGFLIASSWIRDAGTIDVGGDGFTVHKKDSHLFIAKDRIAYVVVEQGSLVLIDDDGCELFRGPLDKDLIPGLRGALERCGYPPLAEADPFDSEFTTWVDGDGRLDGDLEDLLRTRRRALADKHPGAAEAALEELREKGIMVRDRDDCQQYRVNKRC
ncbi:YqeB family protein [Corynebacterium flavescens]|uniref:YqeB family protein n=1 Tax=Corynebacterium flavescens TaxID=28028 RepID=UPI003FCF043B